MVRWIDLEIKTHVIHSVTPSVSNMAGDELSNKKELSAMVSVIVAVHCVIDPFQYRFLIPLKEVTATELDLMQKYNGMPDWCAITHTHDPAELERATKDLEVWKKGVYRKLSNADSEWGQYETDSSDTSDVHIHYNFVFFSKV